MVTPLRRRRARQALDINKLSQAASRPGVDPRTWVCLGRLIEIAFDGDPLVVAYVEEGPLQGEKLTCEVATFIARSGAISSAPFAVGDLAIIVLPGGDGNVAPCVVGFQRAGDGDPPRTVNGRPVSLELLGSTYVLADAERAAELELDAVRLVCSSLAVGPNPAPTQPFVRGQALASALLSYLQAQGIFAGALTTAIGASAPTEPGFKSLLAAVAPWVTSMTELAAHLVPGDALSTHFKGE